MYLPVEPGRLIGGRKIEDAFVYCELSRNTNLKNALWTKGLQKVVRWFLDADDNPANLIITGTFCPIYNVPWKICIRIHSVVFAL